MTIAGDPNETMHNRTTTGWAARMEALADDDGYFQRLGASHSAMFVEDGPVLLVTFEPHPASHPQSDQETPFGYRLAQENGWSSLSLICDHESWFRAPEVYAYIDRLIDEAFFEDFDRVVFYGAGSCGYAAAAYSVAAPGSCVIALQPQATLDPRLTGWDARFRHMRRTAFDDRYGFAPDMLEGVGRAFVLFDPYQGPDAMHAALFARPGVSLLPCRNIGDSVERMLDEMRILEPLIAAACAGTLDEDTFWRLYRARRTLPRYLRNVANRLDLAERPLLEALLCRNVAERLNGPRFRQRLFQLEERLDDLGIPLPPPRG